MARSAVSTIALVVLAGLAACGGDPVSEPAATVPTTVTTVPAATTTTTLAPLIAGPVTRWGSLEVTSVCLQVVQEYPQVPGYSFDLARVLAAYLQPIGITVGPAGGACTATIDAHLVLEGRPAEYEDLGTVYTGMYRVADLTMSAPDQTPLVFHHLTDTQPSELATSFGPTTPVEFVDEYASAWARIVLDPLVEWWGYPVAVEALRTDELAAIAYSHLCDVSGSAAGECPAFDYTTWRAWYDDRWG